jgi:hypothetical protein
MLLAAGSITHVHLPWTIRTIRRVALHPRFSRVDIVLLLSLQSEKTVVKQALKGLVIGARLRCHQDSRCSFVPRNRPASGAGWDGIPLTLNGCESCCASWLGGFIARPPRRHCLSLSSPLIILLQKLIGLRANDRDLKSIASFRGTLLHSG